MKISVSGKGGSGKTTTAGVLARAFAQQGYQVLAIDGDNNPNLGIALGLTPEQVNALPVLPRDLLRDERNVDGSIRQVLSKDLEAIANDYGVDAPDHIRLLVMNRIDHGSKG